MNNSRLFLPVCFCLYFVVLSEYLFSLILIEHLLWDLRSWLLFFSYTNCFTICDGISRRISWLPVTQELCTADPFLSWSKITIKNHIHPFFVRQKRIRGKGSQLHLLPGLALFYFRVWPTEDIAILKHLAVFLSSNRNPLTHLIWIVPTSGIKDGEVLIRRW